MKFSEILKEGGNIFKGDLSTDRIPKALIMPTVLFLEKITGLKFSNNLLGSTNVKESSGDIDIGISEDEISKEYLINKLSQWVVKNYNITPKTFIKKSGINVHFRCPMAGDQNLGFVQVDFMFVPDITYTKWAMKADPTSNYKNKERTILLNSIAKSKGLLFGYLTGLRNRETGELLKSGNNPVVIAKYLLGNSATVKDISSVENILKYIRKFNNDQQKEMLKDFNDSLAKSNLPTFK